MIDEADILITQNGISFDIKKLNARFILNGMKPPSPVRHIDTLRIARKHFAFTSNKLEYLSNNLAKKYVKLKTKRFIGFDLWRECMAGNLKAWKEMERYNKRDVLALQEVYNKLVPWEPSINFKVYDPGNPLKCTCGSIKMHKQGFFFTNTGKFQRYTCVKCGKHTVSKINLLSKEDKVSLRKGV